jgi:hypothetical protein
MRVNKQTVILCILFFIISACATTQGKKADKYNLDDQLEVVSDITRYNLMSWETVDNQSFILQTSPSQFYLIVLIQPSNDLVFTESISISHTGAMIKPGYDRVTVFGPTKSEPYVIDKIFKLKDREEAKAIKAQLKG